MGRPLGVTILGAGMIVAGLGFGSAGVFFFLMGSSGASAAATTSGPMATMLAALGAAAGVLFLFFGALHVILAIAIFQLKNIARVMTIFLFLLIGGGACLGLVATLVSFSHISLIWNISILVLDSLALWYLLRASTKEAFHA